MIARRKRVCVVEVDDVAGFARRQEIGLSAAVIADDRQTERHRFEKHQTKAFVLTRGDERVGDDSAAYFCSSATWPSRCTRCARQARRARCSIAGASGPSPTISR